MGRRIVAVMAALVMIVGALAWRYRPSGSDPVEGPSPTGQLTDAAEIVCTPDLVDACRRAASGNGVQIAQQGVNTTLSATTSPEAWVTLTPLPAAAASAATTTMTTTPVASSTLSLVVLNDRSAALTARCGDPVDWVCLGEIAGTSWGDVGGEAGWGTVRPGLSSTDTAIGAVGVTAAVGAYFDNRSIDAADPTFISWARQFARAVPTSTLSAGTAAQTIQVRSSTLDIAVGASAELSSANSARFDTVSVGDDATVTVVVATPDGARPPDGFVDALRRELTDAGWDPASTTNDPVPGTQVQAALAAWEEMQ